MAMRDYVVIGVALALGAASTEAADSWGTHSGWAETWFYSLAPTAVELVTPALAWVAATLVYALQALAIYGVAEAVWEVLTAPVRRLAR